MNPPGLVESFGDGHAGFGRRFGETHRWKHRQGAPNRPHLLLAAVGLFAFVGLLAGKSPSLPAAFSQAQVGTGRVVRGKYGGRARYR
ncbi:hypothetical protein GCM10010254_11010 [Streptomyces chromofuscus]|nr:hypothetical protein GCM10010254_11010 [Streptomyces chromofuscus]